MNGRIEKMPSVTRARVAKVQKKSFERKAWKNDINPGSLNAASAVTMPAAMNTATTGQNSEPSGARRIANNAMMATRNAAPQMMAAAPMVTRSRERGREIGTGSL